MFHPLTGIVATVAAIISLVLAVVNNWRSHKKFEEASKLSMIAGDQARQMSFGEKEKVLSEVTKQQQQPKLQQRG